VVSKVSETPAASIFTLKVKKKTAGSCKTLVTLVMEIHDVTPQKAVMTYVGD
jgi:hypothetical protein